MLHQCDAGIDDIITSLATPPLAKGVLMCTTGLLLPPVFPFSRVAQESSLLPVVNQNVLSLGSICY